MNTRLYMRNCPRTMLTFHLPTILVSDHVHVSLCDSYEMLAPSLHWRISRNEPPYRSPTGLALPKRRAKAATMRPDGLARLETKAFYGPPLRFSAGVFRLPRIAPFAAV